MCEETIFKPFSILILIRLDVIRLNADEVVHVVDALRENKTLTTLS